jgi:hypothetical protein
VAMTLLFFTAGLESYTYMNNIAHVITSPFGFDIGLALGMFFFCFVILQWQQKEFNIRTFIVTLFVFLACSGTKAPIACVLLCGLGVFCLYWMFIEKKWGMGFLYGTGCFLILVLLLLA